MYVADIDSFGMPGEWHRAVITTLQLLLLRKAYC